MFDLSGSLQHYAWGDRRVIPRLLGLEPDGRPYAELWLGTHPGGPSTVETAGGRRPLQDVSGQLPYLVKVLAAGEPLSLQTHPDAATAAAGFAREEAMGIALSAPERIYRDPNPKPEILCAIEPVEALSGFRPIAESAQLLRDLHCRTMVRLADRLEAEGLAATLRYLLVDRPPIIEGVVGACRAHRGVHEGTTRWVDRLALAYPGDPALAVVPLLHYVKLEPGEAIYLPAGNVHAYLSGAGIEVMGSSDNVVRAGFTPKHIDVEELLHVIVPVPIDDPVVRPREAEPGTWTYETPGAPFAVSRLELTGPRVFTATGPEILVCLEGDAGPLQRGGSAFVEPGERFELCGPATIYRAGTAA
jgi:mannose-6-phosphate isomerase